MKKKNLIKIFRKLKLDQDYIHMLFEQAGPNLEAESISHKL